MRKLKAGIIGLGRIASLYEEDDKAKKYYPYLTHAGSYAKHPQVELVCGADIDRDRCRKFKKMWKIDKVYTDYERMLEENKIDILSVCTHPDLHYEIIKKASKYVKVIFCEKPFTGSAGEIKKLIKLKNRAGLKIAVNLYRQYDPSHNKVKSLIKNEKFGKVQRVNCYYGKGLRNIGAHALGYLLSIFGDPKKIKVLKKILYKGVNEFTYDAYLEFAQGIPVFMQSCDFNKYRLFEYDFICEKGRIQIVDEGLTIKVFEVQDNKAETGAFELFERRSAIKSTVGEALHYAVDHLVKLFLKEEKHPVVSPEDYLKLQKLIESIEKQGEKHAK